MGWSLREQDLQGRPVRRQYYVGATLPSLGFGGTNTPNGEVKALYSVGADAQNNPVAAIATIADEAGRSRTQWFDGLGRMNRVGENGIGAATIYSYDTLAQLTGVTQGSPATRRRRLPIRLFAVEDSRDLKVIAMVAE